MIVLGVDPSSGKSGLAIWDGQKVIYRSVWIASKTRSLPGNLAAFALEVEKLCGKHKVEKVMIEKVSVSWNVNTIRKIAYFEAAAMLAAKMNGVDKIEQINVTSARKKVLGNGGLSKIESNELIRKKVNDQLMGPDEADAVLLAMAG